MLNELIEIRNIALENYYLTENKQQLGLYNKAVVNLENYLQSQECLDAHYNRSIPTYITNPLKSDNISLFKIKDENNLDISDVDMYTVDFDLDLYGEK